MRYKETKPNTPMTPVERHRRSRELMVARLGWLIDKGYPVYVMPQLRGMPRAHVLWHLIADSADLRRRYEQAADVRRGQLADATVLLTDRLADDSRSGRRMRVAIRKWRAEMEKRTPGWKPSGGGYLNI